MGEKAGTHGTENVPGTVEVPPVVTGVTGIVPSPALLGATVLLVM